MPTLTTMTTKFFKPLVNHPIITSIATGVTTFAGLLIGTFVVLIPSTEDKNDATNERNDARDERDSAQAKYNAAEKNVKQSKQRVLDLDCAKAGYKQFNFGVNASYQQITQSSLTPIQILDKFWQINYLPDEIRHIEEQVPRSWDEAVDDSYMGCTSYSCGSDYNACCMGMIYSSHTETHYYTEIARVTEEYRAITNGNVTEFKPLECGFYARRFRVDSPYNYVSYESTHQDGGGDRDDGTTYVDFTRQFGSKISGIVDLDDKHDLIDLTVLRTSNHTDSAADLAANLLKILTVAFSAFSETGGNYTNLQISIQDQIPGLMQIAAALNETLVAKEDILGEKEDINCEMNRDYHQDLTLWMLLLFLVSLGAGLGAFALMKCCKVKPENNSRDQMNIASNGDVENPLSSQNTYARSAYFFKPSYEDPRTGVGATKNNIVEGFGLGS